MGMLILCTYILEVCNFFFWFYRSWQLRDCFDFIKNLNLEKTALELLMGCFEVVLSSYCIIVFHESMRSGDGRLLFKTDVFDCQ